MKYLISEEFKRRLESFPDRTWSAAVVSKLSDFCNKLAAEKGKFRNLPAGFWVRNIKGTRIFKFRVNSGDRILFALYSMIDGYRDEYANSIIFVDYCTHDKQVRKGRNVRGGLDPSVLEIDTTPFIEETKDDKSYADVEMWSRKWNQTGYDLNKAVTYVLDDRQLSALMEEDNKDWLFYLNDKQYQCVRHIKTPLLLRGSAGSGKTTVALHKLLTSSIGEQRVAYFTYTKYLLENAQSLYLRYKNESSNAEFFRFNSYCESIIDASDYQVVTFERFRIWFIENTYRNKFFEGFDPVDIWAEIRGMVKGFMGLRWDRNTELPLFDKQAYLGLSDKYSAYSRVERESIYAITLKYQEWLEESGMQDENDLARQANLKNRRGNYCPFDYIVVDEAQDLTEMQLCFLFNLVKEPGNIFFSGDEHQTVNPTYFGFHRIRAYFTEMNISHELVSLQQNYRSQSKIVDLANQMISLRRQLIGATSCDYHETFVREGSKPFLVTNNQPALEDIIKTANERHYCIIVTADDHEKQKFKSKLGDNSRVFTVSEIKGLEYPYVICCNLISCNRNYWEDIFQRRGRRDARYRYFFNSFYVAITRAREKLCVYENDGDISLFAQLENTFEYIDQFNEEQMGLTRFSSAAEWVREAKNLEDHDKLEQAIGSYKNAKDDKGVARCQAKLLAKSGNYVRAGDLVMNVGMYNEAYEYYQLAGDEYKTVKSRIWAGESFASICELGYSLQQQISLFTTYHKSGDDFAPFIDYLDNIVRKEITEKDTYLSELIALL